MVFLLLHVLESRGIYREFIDNEEEGGEGEEEEEKKKMQKDQEEYLVGIMSGVHVNLAQMSL